MFQKDVEAMKCLNVQRAYVEHIYSGCTLLEASAMIKKNPAAIAVVRREDVEFDKAIRDAQAFRVEVMIDKLEDISQYESEPAMAATVSRNIQWLASKRMRSIYGDKMDVNHTHTINIRDAMDAARARVMHDVTPNLLIENNNAADALSVAPAPLHVAEAGEIDPLS